VWPVAYRDILILDADNFLVDVVNATEHDLTDPAEAADFRARLEAAVP
jgi:hypothetical protein